MLKGNIALIDFVVLAGIYGAYVWRVRNLPKTDNPDEAEERLPCGSRRQDVPYCEINGTALSVHSWRYTNLAPKVKSKLKCFVF